MNWPSKGYLSSVRDVKEGWENDCGILLSNTLTFLLESFLSPFLSFGYPCVGVIIISAFTHNNTMRLRE